MAKLNWDQFRRWMYDKRWPGMEWERQIFAITLKHALKPSSQECPDCRRDTVVGSLGKGQNPAFRGKCTICKQAWLLRPFMIAVKLLDSELKEGE